MDGSSGPKGSQDAAGAKDAVQQPVIKTEEDSPTAEMADKAISVPPPTKKEVAAKAEDGTGKSGTEPPPGIQTTVVTMVTTKSGRASKPSTPALATFAEAQARPRSGRNAESASAGGSASSSATTTTTATAAPKRSHKKNAGSQHVVTPVPLPVQGGQSAQQQHQGGAGQSQKGTSTESTPAPMSAGAKDGNGNGGHKNASHSRDRGTEKRDDGRNGERGAGSAGGDGGREDGGSGGGGGGSKRNRSGNKTAQASSGDVDDEAVDPNEEVYCYCNGVSYGEMVACDSEDCAREWFHLECVGLKVAPSKAGEFFFCFTSLLFCYS